MAKIARWNEQIGIFFTEDDMTDLELRPCYRFDMIFEAGQFLLCDGTRGEIHQATYGVDDPSHPWKIVFKHGSWGDHGAPTSRFGPTEVSGERDRHGDITLCMPSLDRWAWPHYRPCASYEVSVELSKDYLLRALALGKEPPTPPNIARMLPPIVRNHVRQGQIQLAMTLLDNHGLRWLQPRATGADPTRGVRVASACL